MGGSDAPRRIELYSLSSTSVDKQKSELEDMGDAILSMGTSCPLAKRVMLCGLRPWYKACTPP
eukprot:scaffold10822_cov51-Attheya_sp.AAC.2